ncbi:hypothetical protein ABIC83_002537 [Roseateles asaccharophilus]|uniref:hypothetical protein n=1 Tax=Roseateles asaccharophilus TaxID=582607 RepID=UPI0038325CF3
MSISRAEAQLVATSFARQYPGAYQLSYKFRDTVQELYEGRASEVYPKAKGGYINVPVHDGMRTYPGRVDIVLSNTHDAVDLLATLKHEVLGHYGLNTLHPENKRALLDGIIGGRSDPLMAVYWSDIDRRYRECGLDVRAEEVFALHCETLAPRSELTQELANVGRAAFDEVCSRRSRTMTSGDLQAIAYLVAERFENRKLAQFTLPGVNEIPRQDPAAPVGTVLAPTIRPSVTGAAAAAGLLHNIAPTGTPLRRHSRP